MAATMEAAMFIMCVCTCACMYIHACAHVHSCMCTCAWDAPTQPHPHTPTYPPPGVYPQISKNSIRLEQIKIFWFCWKIYDLWRHIHLCVGVWLDGWVGYWVGQWVGSFQITRNSIIWKLIKIIQFCLKVFVLWRHPHPIPPTQPSTPLGYTQISNNSIGLESIEIIQLFEDLNSVETPSPMGGWMVWWVG